MPSGGNTSTTVQKSDPWQPVQEPLKETLPIARYLWSQSAYAPQTFKQHTGLSEFAGPSGTTQDALRRMARQARGMSGGSPLESSMMDAIRRAASGGFNRWENAGADAIDRGMRGSSLSGIRNHLLDMTRGGRSDEMGLVSRILGGFQDQSIQNQSLDQAKQYALSSAIPAATSMFAGSGMANSSQAMDTVGRAALDATAPYDYGAAESSMGRALQAASTSGGLEAALRGQDLSAMNLYQGAREGDMRRRMAGGQALAGLGQNRRDQALRGAAMAPGAMQASFIPEQMLMNIGQYRDQMRQGRRDARVENYYDQNMRHVDNLRGYLSDLMGIGGIGGTSTATGPSGEPSMLQKAGSGVLGGLGTYGALAGMPGIGPGLAVGGGVLSGLMGLF